HCRAKSSCASAAFVVTVLAESVSVLVPGMSVDSDVVTIARPQPLTMPATPRVAMRVEKPSLAPRPLLSKSDGATLDRPSRWKSQSHDPCEVERRTTGAAGLASVPAEP